MPGTLLLVALALVWEAAVQAGWVNADSLPAPTQIIVAAVSQIGSDGLLGAAAHTLLVTLAGWAIASVAGTALGLLLGLSRGAWRWGMTSVEILRALPGISFVPLAILLLGVSAMMELLIVVYVAVWPVAISMVSGAREVTPTHLELAASLRMSRRDRIVKIVLPSAMPHLVVGLRLGLAAALALAVVAEMVGNPQGIGYQLVFEQQALQPARMFTCVVLIGFMGLVLNWGFMTLLRRLAPGVHTFLREDPARG